MKKIKSVVLAATCLSLSGCGFEIVDTGNRGVETRFGEVVSKDALPEGMHFYNPLTSDIIELSVRTLTWNAETAAYTKDGQQATVQFSVNYNLSADAVIEVFKELGYNWEDKLVKQKVPAALKNTVGRWEALDLIANRSEATRQIETELVEGLKSKGVTVTRFELTNVDYTDEFEKSIEDKVIAIQRATQEENKTKQIEEQAKQKLITAQAEAEAMRIQAKALTENKALVEYEAVKKWDGKMPTYMMGDSVPFINLK